jgi:hypothetical protein
MTQFVREVLGLRVNFEEASTTEFVTVEGDALQVIGPGHPYFDFFGQHALGPVPLFEVTDLHAAASELRAAGIETVGSTGVDSNWRWIHFGRPTATCTRWRADWKRHDLRAADVDAGAPASGTAAVVHQDRHVRVFDPTHLGLREHRRGMDRKRASTERWT